MYKRQAIDCANVRLTPISETVLVGLMQTITEEATHTKPSSLYYPLHTLFPKMTYHSKADTIDRLMLSNEIALGT